MRDRLPRLLHPAFLAALSVLAANDHVLKTAAPGVVTGKLSDIAGLVVLPVLLSVLLARTVRGAWAVHVAVGAAFAAAQWVPSDAVVGWGAQIGVVLVHTPDPTDLLALAVLPLGVHLATTERTRIAPRVGRRLSPAVVALALVAVLATGMPPPKVLTEEALFQAPDGVSALAELERRLDSLGVTVTDLDTVSARDYAVRYASRDRSEDSLAWQREVDTLTARYAQQRAESRAGGWGRYEVAVPLAAVPSPSAVVELRSRWDPRTQLVWVSALDPAQWNRPTGFPGRGPERKTAFRDLVLERLLRPIQDRELRAPVR